jgi:hypothetical protein
MDKIKFFIYSASNTGAIKLETFEEVVNEFMASKAHARASHACGGSLITVMVTYEDQPLDPDPASS